MPHAQIGRQPHFARDTLGQLGPHHATDAVRVLLQLLQADPARGTREDQVFKLGRDRRGCGEGLDCAHGGNAGRDGEFAHD